jgi:vacuolar-type H+-ATPase subunit I/STV1
MTADGLKMKLRTFSKMPVVNRLINTVSMLEAKESGSFNLGVGNGESQIHPVIAPFFKVSDSDALVYLDNKYVKVSENEDPSQVSSEIVEEFPDFFEVCEAFRALNFRNTGSEIVATGRNLTVAFGINENGTLNLKLNNQVVEKLDQVKFSEIFLMEGLETRNALTKIFDNLDLIVNVEFGKSLLNERLGRDSIVLNLGENIFVFEKLGDSRILKKMKDLTFHSYVMENFKYDISELYSIQLEERDARVKELDSEKTVIERNLEKLEKSISQIEEALKDRAISAEYQDKLNELKMSIEKNVNALKNQYILVDQSKKKF